MSAMYWYVKNKNLKPYTYLLAIALATGSLIGWGIRSQSVFAQSINQISVAASLFDSESKLIINGEYSVRFALYQTDRATADAYPSNADAGSRLWEETQTVTVKNGILRAFLGSSVALPPDLNFESGDYYLGIRVGTDSEMVPRKKLGAVPAALNSQFLRGRTSGTSEGNLLILGKNGKVNIKQLPVGTGANQLVRGDDSRLGDSHQQNTDISTDSEIFTIGDGTSATSTNFDLAVSNSATPPALRYNGSTQAWQLSNDGTTFSDISSGLSGSVILGTGTDGDYVESISNGNGIFGGDGGSEGAALSLSINLLDSADGTGSISSESGLEFQGLGNDELTLLQGCADTQLLAWDDTNNVWECSTVSGAGGLSGSGGSGQAAFWTSSTTLSGENQLNPSRGGTGVDGSLAANGSLLIGNGTGYTLATLTQGTGITVTNGAGSITIASTLGTSIDLTTEVTGTLPVGSGGTGATTFTSGGVLYGNSTSAVQVTAAGTNGQLLLGVTAGAPTFATMSSDASITNAGVLTIAADAVALTTDTTGNYVANVQTSVLTGLTGGSAGSEGASLTLNLDYSQALTGDVALGANAGVFGQSGFAFEGSSADTIETYLVVTNPTASDKTITFPDASGTVVLSGGTLFTAAGTSGSSQTISQGDTLTIAAGTGITTTGGATDTITIASTLGTSIDLTTEVTGTLPVGNGGTGATTFTANGVLYGNTTGAVQVTAAGTNGQLLLGVTAGAPDFRHNEQRMPPSPMLVS